MANDFYTLINIQNIVGELHIHSTKKLKKTIKIKKLI